MGCPGLLEREREGGREVRAKFDGWPTPFQTPACQAMQILGLYIARPVFMRTLCLGHDLAHVLVSLLQNSFSTTTRQKKKTFQPPNATSIRLITRPIGLNSQYQPRVHHFLGEQMHFSSKRIWQVTICTKKRL